MNFTKVQGAGNDFILVETSDARSDWSELAVAVCDRHFGIGADGLLLLLPSEVADLRMRIFNADGSESNACGNGLRCLVKYALDKRLTNNKAQEISVEGESLKFLDLDYYFKKHNDKVYSKLRDSVNRLCSNDTLKTFSTIVEYFERDEKLDELKDFLQISIRVFLANYYVDNELQEDSINVVLSQKLLPNQFNPIVSPIVIDEIRDEIQDFRAKQIFKEQDEDDYRLQQYTEELVKNGWFASNGNELTNTIIAQKTLSGGIVLDNEKNLQVITSKNKDFTIYTPFKSSDNKSYQIEVSTPFEDDDSASVMSLDKSIYDLQFFTDSMIALDEANDIINTSAINSTLMAISW